MTNSFFNHRTMNWFMITSLINNEREQTMMCEVSSENYLEWYKESYRCFYPIII